MKICVCCIGGAIWEMDLCGDHYVSYWYTNFKTKLLSYYSNKVEFLLVWTDKSSPGSCGWWMLRTCRYEGNNLKFLCTSFVTSIIRLNFGRSNCWFYYLFYTFFFYKLLVYWVLVYFWVSVLWFNFCCFVLIVMNCDIWVLLEM